ncbi:MAG: putative peptidoglycan glycosyltransferase FtsW [Gemmatimonadota bacterium]|nr:putative peptidoglycan glycosyltransferase FtsW [Gemmatimonadota bacterium]MDE2985291.1 putative peptidoglycan glycosyltransferase FtsW [Gemmatimonadota bacterium]
MNARQAWQGRSLVWAVDVAPGFRASLSSTGLGRGWESATVVALIGALLLFGLLTLHSASSVMAQRVDLPHYHYVGRQATGVVIGMLAMFACARVPTEYWQRFAPHLMLGSLALLIVVILPFTHAIAPEVNGARRWLRVGVTVQPSDLAKLAVIVWTAAMLVRKREYLRSLRRGLAPFLVGWTLVLVPIMLEPDVSTACLIVATGVTVAFVGGARVGHFVFLGLPLLPLAGTVLVSGYRGARWQSLLLDPGTGADGSAFQAYQSLVAIGSGGVTGVGFGEGRQKFGFLPEAHNDFIFAMIGEEWGFAGALAVILCFLALLVVGFRIARQARNLFSQLLAVGIVSLIGFQAFLHIGVGLGVFPATGLSLPFISFGRTNLVVMLAAVGMLLAVAREASGGEA